MTGKRVRHGAARAGVILCGLILGFAACRGPGVDQAAVRAAVERLADRTIDPEARPISSELMELAGGYSSLGKDDEPRHFAMLLNVGEDALAARLHAIRAARESIDLQVYVWALDESGSLVYREMIHAARRGVRVRLLIDQLANKGVDQSAEVALDHRNLEVRLYNPVAETTALDGGDLAVEAIIDFDRLNQRMHNKVMIVDGRVAIVGGRNIEDHYFDLDPEFCYLDRDLLVAGPVLEDVRESFEAYWEHPLVEPLIERQAVGRRILEIDATDVEERIDAIDEYDLSDLDWIRGRSGRRKVAEVLPHSRVHEVGVVEFFADPPKKLRKYYSRAGKLDEDDPRSLELKVDRYLLMQSNYLIFGEQQLHGARELLAQEPPVEVAYLTNSLAATANLLTYAGGRKQRLELLYQGLDVREMRPFPADVKHFLPRIDELIEEGGGFPQIAIHAKSLVIDDEIALVGSHNFDPRSYLLNTEAFFVVHDYELTQELAGEMRLLMAPGNSWVVQRVERIPVWTEVNALFASASRALPILDIWPWFGYACYELREGQEPVPHDHPDFYEHYREVGEFPELPAFSKGFKTWLLTMFIAPMNAML